MKDKNIVPPLFVCFVLLGLTILVFFPADRIMSATVPTDIHKKIRILIVPGHEPNFGGAEFKGIKERDLAVEIGGDLKKLLEADGKYEVFITRDTMTWSPIFSSYFKKNWNSIIAWKNKSAQDDNKNISAGLVTKPVSIVYHNSVSKDVAIRLYGITKWVNENNIDLMIHIHLNDDAEHGKNKVGTYSGFAIYVPAPQFSNSVESHNIAQTLFTNIKTDNTISSLKKEAAGIIDEPKLIAIGAHNTSKVPSLLIEYGYIYENKFLKSTLRHTTIKNLAQDTFLGIQDYYSNK